MVKYVQIQIPKACHENWDNMDATAQGKFCNSCKKHVIDFTLMSDDDLAIFFKKNKENVCGRFANDQLKTDIPIPTKKIPWLKYFFTITIPAFLFSQKTNAQLDKLSITEKHVVNKKRVLSEIPIKATVLRGNIQTIPQSTSSLEISTKETLVTFTLGGAFSGSVIRKNNTYLSPILNSVPNSISLYPNPVSALSPMTIKWKNNISAKQTIEIYDQTGDLQQHEIISVSKKNNQHSIELKQIPAGTYIIKITDNKTYKSTSQQFIVQ